MHFGLAIPLFLAMILPHAYLQCMDPNSTALSSPPYLGLDKTMFDGNGDLQLAFEWNPPVNSRVVTDVKLNGDANCSYYDVLNAWTAFLDPTSSCNAGIQGTLQWPDITFACENSFTKTILPTSELIAFSMTLTYQENITTPASTLTRTTSDVIPIVVDLPTTTQLTFGPPLSIASKTSAPLVIFQMAGNLSNFDSLGFASSVSNYLNISSWRVIMMPSSLRDFHVEFSILPGPDSEENPDYCVSQLKQGVSGGSFYNQTGFQAISMLDQDFSIETVVTFFSASNPDLYEIQIQTYVADFPSPAGILAQEISFSGNSTDLYIVQTGNSTNGNFFVQDWSIFLAPGRGCYTQGLLTINYLFFGANPVTNTTTQFSVDSSSTCPSIINPSALTGTVYAYTDLSLATKTQALRQTDTVYFQAEITNNVVPILDNGLVVTEIQIRGGSGAWTPIVQGGLTNYTGLNYGALSISKSAIVWMTVDPEVFTVTNQYDVFTFVFSLGISYQNKRQATPSQSATAAANLVIQSSSANVPSSSSSLSMASSATLPSASNLPSSLPSLASSHSSQQVPLAVNVATSQAPYLLSVLGVLFFFV